MSVTVSGEHGAYPPLGIRFELDYGNDSLILIVVRAIYEAEIYQPSALNSQ